MNKAQDIFGLSSEHLKFAPHCLYRIISSLMNCILHTGYVPPQLKQAILTPVLKKKKDATQPTNYRGITVLSILGKILERVIQNRTKDQIEAQQSRMQRGFTSNSSAVNAALIVSETQNEAKELGEPLKLVTLDACKAFDVVWQESLLRKLFNAGIQGSFQAEILEAFKSTSRYLDDLLNIDNPYFEGMVNRIYPPELQLNKANTSDTEAPFLDLHLSISNGSEKSEINDWFRLIF